MKSKYYLEFDLSRVPRNLKTKIYAKNVSKTKLYFNFDHSYVETCNLTSHFNPGIQKCLSAQIREILGRYKILVVRELLFLIQHGTLRQSAESAGDKCFFLFSKFKRGFQLIRALVILEIRVRKLEREKYYSRGSRIYSFPNPTWPLCTNLRNLQEIPFLVVREFLFLFQHELSAKICEICGRFPLPQASKNEAQVPNFPYKPRLCQPRTSVAERVEARTQNCRRPLSAQICGRFHFLVVREFLFNIQNGLSA